MKKLINGFEKERNLLVISSIIIAIFIFFGIDLSSFELSHENALLTLMALSLYFSLRLFLEWLKSSQAILDIAVPFLLAIIAMSYTVYELTLITISWEYSKIGILILLGIGELVLLCFL